MRQEISNSQTSHSEASADYILVGGGLQSGLMALAIAYHQPKAEVRIIEQSPTLAGNHTWSFHATDLADDCAPWANALVEAHWPAYQVRIGNRSRTISIPYCTCSSEHFVKVLTASWANSHRQILTNTAVVDMNSQGVTLGDGRRLHGAIVIDNRGAVPINTNTFIGGYQKFWGFELELNCDWPHRNPIVMDDQIDQQDGFRFIYSLPMEPRRVLIEDTRFSNTPTIDRADCLEKVRAYTKSHGCHDWKIIREESGVLPMPIVGNLPGIGLPKLAGGYRGGWFHAATGYSFPLALRVAHRVATYVGSDLSGELQQLSREHAWRARFARFLNRLLFELVKPQTRYQIFRRFYRVLDEAAIGRFYGHRFTPSDAFRIVVGIPPMGLRPLNFLRSFVKHTTRRVSNPPSTQSLKVPG